MALSRHDLDERYAQLAALALTPSMLWKEMVWSLGSMLTCFSVFNADPALGEADA
jgi:hypothetical protein